MDNRKIVGPKLGVRLSLFCVGVQICMLLPADSTQRGEEICTQSFCG